MESIPSFPKAAETLESHGCDAVDLKEAFVKPCLPYTGSEAQIIESHEMWGFEVVREPGFSSNPERVDTRRSAQCGVADMWQQRIGDKVNHIAFDGLG